MFEIALGVALLLAVGLIFFLSVHVSKKEQVQDKVDDVQAMWQDTCMRVLGRPYCQNRNDRRRIKKYLEKR